MLLILLLMEEKVPSFFRFEDLRVYGKAVEYNRWLITVLKEPRSESERVLCQSFIKSALDITLNIAEGSSRTKVQFDHYLKISKSAMRECIISGTVANALGLLSDEDCQQSRELLMELTRMVGALIVSLQRGWFHHPKQDYNRDETRANDPEDSMIDNDFDSEFDDMEG